ncbi:HAD family hydrolase [Marisediminicola senii]|uniref:HAD family hydrolase n=1 Tax=Marisediminicola senii TaxID=2711233 RepID=UPI0013EBEA7E|nr:HAD-IB family hydrolase [Marisediminicola senii]
MSTPRSDDSASAPAAGGASGRTVIAFFDVDNTLLRGASAFHLGRGAQRRGVVRRRELVRFLWHQVRFLVAGENARGMPGIQHRALGLIRGHSQAQLIEIAHEVYDDYIVPRLWPETVELTREHLRQGHEVWLISATPVMIADVIAKRLGFAGALATRIESENGVYTGNLLGAPMHGAHKAVAARDLAESRGADLAECWAYSDSGNDIPLLGLVGNRVVVNPDRALRRHATENGWSQMRLTSASIRAARRRVAAESRAEHAAEAHVTGPHVTSPRTTKKRRTSRFGARSGGTAA